MLKILGGTHSVDKARRIHISENFVQQKFIVDVYVILAYNIVEK